MTAAPPTSEEYEQATRAGYLLLILGLGAVLSTWIVYGLHVRQYFQMWTQPRTQTLILRVVSLIPIWATLGLVNMSLPAAYLQYRYIVQIFLDVFESFAIISFMQLIYNYLGGREQAHWKAENKTPYRVCFCVMAYPGERMMQLLHVCIYQFAITRPLISTLSCILIFKGVAKGKGSLLESNVDLAMTVLTFVFLILAMWGLLQVYRIFRVVLRPYDVGKKFIAIKLYILLHVIQGFVFGYIDNAILNKNNPPYMVEANFIKIEYLLFVLEMLGGALLNKYVFFNVQEYVDPDAVDDTVVRERIRLATSQTAYDKLTDQEETA